MELWKLTFFFFSGEQKNTLWLFMSFLLWLDLNKKMLTSPFKSSASKVLPTEATVWALRLASVLGIGPRWWGSGKGWPAQRGQARGRLPCNSTFPFLPFRGRRWEWGNPSSYLMPAFIQFLLSIPSDPHILPLISQNINAWDRKWILKLLSKDFKNVCHVSLCICKLFKM